MGPIRHLTPQLLRLGAEQLAPTIEALVELVRAMPVLLEGLEIAVADARASCLVSR